MTHPDAPILGIDPGLSRLGFGAVVRESSARVRALRYGVIRTDPQLELPTRLALLYDELVALVDEIRPRVMVVERVLFQVNARTAISVGQASGLALTIAARNGIEVVQYSPNEVKLAIAGDGGAGKYEVATMVSRLLHLEVVPKPADATDALALAVCHAWRERSQRAYVTKTNGTDQFLVDATATSSQASRSSTPSKPSLPSKLDARIAAALAKATR